jgi:hypothetical protein
MKGEKSLYFVHQGVLQLFCGIDVFFTENLVKVKVVRDHRGRAAVTRLPRLALLINTPLLKSGKADKNYLEAGKPPLMFSVARANRASALLAHPATLRLYHRAALYGDRACRHYQYSLFLFLLHRGQILLFHLKKGSVVHRDTTSQQLP